jgi:hypothetical protein
MLHEKGLNVKPSINLFDLFDLSAQIRGARNRGIDSFLKQRDIAPLRDEENAISKKEA